MSAQNEGAAARLPVRHLLGALDGGLKCDSPGDFWVLGSYASKASSYNYDAEVGRAMKIKVLMLGTGTPELRPHRCGSATLLQVGEDHILIDCGYGAVRRMAENHIRLQDVQHLLFTHHHYDHNVDYPSFVLHGRSGRKNPLNVYGPVGTGELTTDLFERGFHRDINHRLSPATVEGIIVSGAKDIDAGFVMEGNDWRLTAERADHFTRNGNFSLCYRIDTDSGSVTFSGDTIPCAGIQKLAKGADVLVHEVFWRPGVGKDGKEAFTAADTDPKVFATSRLRKHSLPEEVKAIAHEAGVKRLVLTHLSTDEHLDKLQGYIQQGLECNVILGEDHMRFESG